MVTTASRTSRPTATRRRRAGVWGWAIVLAAALLLTLTFAVTVGSAGIGMVDVWRTVAAHLHLGTSPLSPIRDGIVWDLRLTRVLTAAAVGGALAMSGAVMQAITRNQLADPYLLGLSSGASLGAVAVLMLGVGLLLPVAAFLGALLALVTTLLLARSLGPISPSRTILAGMTVSALASAIASMLIFWNVTGDSYREILNWLLGSLAGSDWTTTWTVWLALLVVGVPLAASGRLLDAFVFGDTAAASLGINVSGARWLLLGSTALLTGVAVSVSGSIGFVGLVLPNAVRLVVGFRHRVLLPVSAVVGAIFMVWVDTGARTLFEPRELPVGIITVLVGAPLFAIVLWRNRSRS
ncbi:putative F420-0 ABC transporter permease subunit [Nakamurella lactea]|uniref:putative F420-0 ABC transporter permease subunit n=1 Tax=Nakamurella lactea TaxID=459515 RepID=UPI0004152821|nr:putative F420-0 ABC transporter permease subunit [Nakamurella lactea]